MFSFEAEGAVIVEQKKALEEALSTNPKTQKVLRALIRKYILEARSEVVRNISFSNGDPRGSAQAVRSAVYRKVFGGNLNIYSSRKSHGSTSYEPPRNPSRVGGNRRPRKGTTSRLMSYGSLDRGFVLRWLNDGTKDRFISFTPDEHRATVNKGSRGGDVSKYGKTVNTGRRGSIAPRHFFRSLGERALATMSENVAKAIEEELAGMLNDN